jgi:hypothetical protein
MTGLPTAIRTIPTCTTGTTTERCEPQRRSVVKVQRLARNLRASHKKTSDLIDPPLHFRIIKRINLLPPPLPLHWNTSEELYS